ncbi:DNA repair protein RecN [Propionibacteriaceae bacterium Y2011]
MISELSISGLGVIDRATVELDPGLTVVTGETGAGKTMIITGLGMLLGQRSDAGAVRTGATRARVEGRVRVPEEHHAAVDEAGGELEDGELLVARQVTAQGRSRSWLSGAQVPMATCAALLEPLLTIHGQSEQVRLSQPERQRALLDRAAGEAVAKPMVRYRTAWQRRRTVVAELTELTEAARERAREVDLLQFGLNEIEQVDPQPGEDATLAAEARRLQDVDDLRADAQRGVLALAGDDDDPTSGALSAVSVAEKAIADLADRDPAAGNLLDAVRRIRIDLADAAAETSQYLDQLEADPARLETITGRRAELTGLTRKYGDTVDEVLAWARDQAVRLDSLLGSDERISLLSKEVDALDAELAELAAVITTARREAADRVAAEVSQELTALAMPRARLAFEVTPAEELGPYGGDRVELMFAANTGAEPRPIGKVASGGELSRVRLALEVVLAATDHDQTYVFDEIDAGVGGAVAVEIGRRLARLAERCQVIVVTHLAQVAAFGDRHLVVTKTDDGSITTSGIHPVGEAERPAELARMMAGLDASDAALDHARELLREAGR